MHIQLGKRQKTASSYPKCEALNSTTARAVGEKGFSGGDQLM